MTTHRLSRAVVDTAAPARVGRPATGFTLIEVLVVTLIAGLLAGSATVTLVAQARSATLDDSLRRISFLDDLARRSARRGGRTMRVAIDLDHGTITVSEGADAAAKGDWVQQLRLPTGQHIARVWLSKAFRNSGDIDEWSEGTVSVRCSADGYTPTYGLRIDTQGGGAGRITFAGLSGEVHRYADDQHVSSLFAALAHGGTPTATDPGGTREP